MALTLSNSNYNGEVLDKIYLELGLGNEIAKENIATIITDIPGKFSLPKMSQSALPIGVFSNTVPNTDSATTTYAERELNMASASVYAQFIPASFLGTIWKKWQSQGNYSNLQLNTELLAAILDLYMNNIGNHYSLLAFQGNTGLGAETKMHYINGWVTRAAADGNVVKPTSKGNITAENFADILAACWASVPSHLIKDPNYTFKISTAIWKFIQSGNLDLKKAYAGILNLGLSDMYLTSKLIPCDGMPDHYVLGSSNKNLYAGFYVAPENESVEVDRVANGSHTWFLRLDLKMDVNYVSSKEIVLYSPV